MMKKRALHAMLAWSVLLTAPLFAFEPANQPLTAPPESSSDAATFAGQVDMGQRYLRLGLLALENDDSIGAVDFLKQALAQSQTPEQRREAANWLQEALLTTGQSDEAGKLFEQAVSSPDFAGHENVIKLMDARRSFFQGDFEKAAGIFRELSVQLVPGDRICMQSLELLGRALHNKGDHQGAIKSYSDLSVAAGTDELWQLRAQEGIIFSALAADKLELAEKAWQNIQKLVPAELQQNFALHLEKISWLIKCRQGHKAAAEKFLNGQLLQIQPPDELLARLAQILGDEFNDDGLKEQALQYYQKAFKLAENAFRQSALRSVIDSQISVGKLKDALQSIKDYLAMFPAAADRQQMLFTQGNIYSHLQQDSAAVSCYKKLFDDPETSSEIRQKSALELAKLYSKAARSREAVKMFRFAIDYAADIRQRNELRQMLGEYFYKLGQYNNAAEIFTDQLTSSADQESDKPALWLAQSYYQLKNYDRSRQALDSALKSQDNDLKRRAEYLSALLAEHLQLPDQSVKELLQFVQRYPRAAETPDALFRAGVLAIGSVHYDAVDILRGFARQYPGEKAANALYRALVETLAAGNEKTASELLNELNEKYPESSFTVGGNFRMSEFLQSSGQHEAAWNMLKKMQEHYADKHPELLPELLFEQAITAGALEDFERKEQFINTIISQHADHELVPQAFFLLGDLKFRQGDFAAALKAFQQAQERSGATSGVFAFGCAGRAGDAAYALYTSSRNEQYLRQAMEIYDQLLKDSELPAEFYFQSLYKLGRCRQDGGSEAGALRCYREVIYQAALAAREKRFYPVQWCAKALDSALKLLVSAARKAPSEKETVLLQREAERLLKVASALDLPGENINQQLEAVYSLPSQRE